MDALNHIKPRIFVPKKKWNGCALGLVQPLIPGDAVLDFLTANRTNPQKSGFWDPWSWVLPALKKKKLERNPRMKISICGMFPGLQHLIPSAR